MNCPHCGSGAVVGPFCCTCSRRVRPLLPRQRRKADPKTCRHRRWSKPNPTMVAGEVRQKCLACGIERQHEVSR